MTIPTGLRLYLYVGIAIAAIAAVTVAHHIVWKAGYNASNVEWQAKWDARDLADLRVVETERVDRELKAAEITKHNEETDHALADKDRDVAAARRDADLARRMLAAAAGHPPAKGGAVPQAPGDPASAGTGGASGDGSAGPLLGLTAAAFSECRRNADRLDALNVELNPQL
jgi:hypothetical protein